jgi:glycolate oxidase iron-sulfur subunit
MGEEMDSPRGRIFLMKEVLEGGLELETALPYIDNCLGCQACQTACPSGVEYGELITPFRAYAEERRERTPMDRVQREMVLRTLPFPRRFRLAARLGRLAKPVARFLPETMGAMLRLLPAELPRAQPLPEVVRAQGPRRGRVALLAGCAQQVLAPDINAATVRVLARNGVEVVIPRGQGCCGALAMHTGAAAQAAPLARRNLEAFPADVDAIVTNAAGCGSAGTYNVEKPDTAAELGARKAQNLLATGADLIATGNIGCMTQVDTHLRALGHPIPVLHTFQVLDRAYDPGSPA